MNHDGGRVVIRVQHGEIVRGELSELGANDSALGGALDLRDNRLSARCIVETQTSDSATTPLCFVSSLSRLAREALSARPLHELAHLIVDTFSSRAELGCMRSGVEKDSHSHSCEQPVAVDTVDLWTSCDVL